MTPQHTAAYQPVDRRTANGRWAPGVSGNPTGRPKGSLNKRTLLLLERLERLLPRTQTHVEVELPVTIDPGATV